MFLILWFSLQVLCKLQGHCCQRMRCIPTVLSALDLCVFVCVCSSEIVIIPEFLSLAYNGQLFLHFCNCFKPFVFKFWCLPCCLLWKVKESAGAEVHSLLLQHVIREIVESHESIRIICIPADINTQYLLSSKSQASQEVKLTTDIWWASVTYYLNTERYTCRIIEFSKYI